MKVVYYEGTLQGYVSSVSEVRSREGTLGVCAVCVVFLSPEHLMLVRLDPVRSADPPMISGMMAARTFNTSSDLITIMMMIRGMV